MRHLKIKNYEITWQNVIDREQIPESLQPEIDKIFPKVQNPNYKTIRKLNSLIEQYPQSPQLKNFLSVAYQAMGETEKALKISDDIFKEHPDYFFGRANKAGMYEGENDFEKMKELMGKEFDLKLLYPDREVFHIREFMTMGDLAVSYFAGIGNIEEAEKRLALMRKVDPEDPAIQSAENKLSFRLMEQTLKRLQKDEELKIEPEVTFVPKSRPETPPIFHLEETSALAKENFGDDWEEVEEYINLDRQKVIADLESLLKDHFYHYPQNYEEYLDAPFHAFMILGELEAEESLPVILEMMGQTEEYYRDVFEDLFNEYAWGVLFKTGRHQLSLLEEYLKEPGKYRFFRSGVLEVLKQIYLHLPAKRMEVTAVYDRLLTFYGEVGAEDNIIDNELNGFLVVDLMDLRQRQFLPQIEKLYEMGYVHPTICGSFEDVAKMMKKGRREPSYHKQELLSLQEIYRDLYEDEEYEDGYEDEYDPEDLYGVLSEPYVNREDSDPYVREHKKIGRNDPCPCGSGKKFKKCCLGNGLYD